MTTLSTLALTGLFAYTGLSGISPAVPAESPPEPTYEMYSVKMSGYNPDPNQTDETPRTTSIGAETTEVIAARTRDLADELPYGTVIAITPATTTPNCGFKYVSERVNLRVIGDAMNERHKNWIDLFFEEEKILAQNGLLRNPAKALGMCHDVQIKVVGEIDLFDEKGKIDPKKVRQIPKTQAALAAAVGLADLALK